MKKRANGEGSISKRPTGYIAQISVGGERLSKSFKFRADASAWLTELTTQRNAGKNLTDKTTLEELAIGWLVSKRPSISINSWSTLETNWRLHIKPDLGHLPVKDASLQLQQLIDKKAQTQSPATIRKVVQVAKELLNLAIDRDMITKIPRLILPKLVERKPELPVADQLPFLLEASNRSKYGFGLWLELGTGIRRSEMLALEWSDYDELNRYISVNKALIRHAGEYHIKETKTTAGNRIIDLPDVVNDVLKQKQSKGRMFATDSGEYLSPWNWQRLWKSWIVQANKLIAKHNEQIDDANNHTPLIGNVRFHDLRHLYATHMLNAGVSPRVAQTLTGHDDMPTLLQRYTHVQPQMKRDAADKLNDILPKPTH